MIRIKEIQAQMQDRKLEATRYNYGSSNLTFPINQYLAYIVYYNTNEKPTFKNNNNFITNETYDYNVNVIKDNGYYTPITSNLKFSDMITRKYYNYIQLRDDNFQNMYGLIPSYHLIMIKEIMKNGLKLYDPQYILDPNIINMER